MKLNTVGDLRKLIADLDDDFKLDVRIMEEISLELLKKKQMNFLHPSYPKV